MSKFNEKLQQDLKFCKELMDRLVNSVDDKIKEIEDGTEYKVPYTVVQNDIIRLRRELNKVRKELDWDYVWEWEYNAND